MPPDSGGNNGGAHLVGVGIPGMHERLRHLGGRLQIESSSRGTTLTATVPLGDDRDDAQSPRSMANR